MTDSDRITEIPPTLRDGLPADLQDADMVGTETAGADESLRLHGPPGTGKSTQSALRIGALAVGEPQLRPSQMTVVTYRRSLADTIRQRLVDWGAVEVPDGVDPNSPDSGNPFRYWTTIHAAAARATGFLRDVDNEDPLAGMVDYQAKRQFCRELDIDFRPPKPWLETRWTVFEDLYQYAKNNLLDVGDWQYIDPDRLTPLRADSGADQRLDEFREQWGGTSFESVVGRWERFKRDHDTHDFYEQLEAALTGSTPPTRLVVIDEYHDATPLMAAVSERWIDAAETAIVAGDPDQVVNAYAGASPRFFEDLGQRVDRDMPVVRLFRSWRCPDEHFQAAARVLRDERKVPTLTTDGPGELLRHGTSQYEHDGDQWHVPGASMDGSPYRLWETHGPEIMFLTRTQKQADGVAAALDEEGVIYRSQSSVGGSWETRLRLLRALDLLEGVAPGDDSRPTSIGDYGGGTEHRSPDHRALAVEDARALLRHTHGRYLDNDEDDRREWLFAYDRNDDPVPLSEFDDHVTDKWWLRYNCGRSAIANFVRLSGRDRDALRAAWDRYDRFDVDLDNIGTRVLTIHASKGVEASDVVVFDGITGRIQESVATDADTRENEARTWYVALTRASERVHIIRDAFAWTDEYLPPDLEPRAARAVRTAADTAVGSSGGAGR
jgi:DNA helicase-2/ATP-dependent DNA helicase PcrA